MPTVICFFFSSEITAASQYENEEIFPFVCGFNVFLFLCVLDLSFQIKLPSAQVLKEILHWNLVGMLMNSTLKFQKMVVVWVNQLLCSIFCNLSESDFMDFPTCTAFALLSVLICDQRFRSLLEKNI